MKWLLALALWTGGAALAASPQDSPRARGAQIARQVCAACHVVAQDQEFPPLLSDPAPPFAVIADRPGTTLKSLRHFIRGTHWDMRRIPMTMPNQMLTQEETREVAQYILSLRKTGPQAKSGAQP